MIVTSSILSISRIFAATRYYNAPLQVTSQFSADEIPRLLNVTGFLPTYPLHEDSPRIDLSPVRVFNLTLCMGKEWYRFPSHYLVPSGINVEFIKSDFDGHLPRHFLNSEGKTIRERVEGTRFVPTDLNDLNREEPSHYVSTMQFINMQHSYTYRKVDVSTCDYLVDTDYPRRPSPSSRSHEKVFADDKESWERVNCKPFLDAANTPALVRILWLPGEQWRERAAWGNYCILRNRQKAEKRESRLWTSASE